MPVAFHLFLLFAQISFVTFGGGLAMLPIIQDIVVNQKAYLSNDLFVNLVAMAQLTPGPVGLNTATYVGFEHASFAGALLATFGMMFPSLTVTWCGAIFFDRFKKSNVINMILRGVRPATIGLIAVAVISFADTSVFTAPLSTLWSQTGARFGISGGGFFIFLIATVLQLYFKMNLILVLLICAALGVALF